VAALGAAATRAASTDDLPFAVPPPESGLPMPPLQPVSAVSATSIAAATQWRAVVVLISCPVRRGASARW
jgi:hypothetical protein